ncbi:MAG: hypothetical protein JKY54_14895 [Flavobacteriales bacterium]|nr:hypothetical protein [Flavobacteriales bacterium]
MDRYIAYLQKEEYGIYTMTIHISNLILYEKWLKRQGESLQYPCEHLIMRYVDYLSAKENSVALKISNLDSLNCYFNYLGEQGIIKENPILTLGLS